MEHSLFLYDIAEEGLDFEAIESSLPEVILNHCKTHTFEPDYHRSLLAWNGLYQELQKRGLAEKFILTFGKAGKPYIDGLYFNIAHSGNLSVLLLSEKECGVDIERINLEKDFTAMARRTLSPKEKEEYENASDKANMFIHFWSRKEAYLKKKGIGIADFSLLREEIPDPIESKIITDNEKNQYWLSISL